MLLRNCRYIVTQDSGRRVLQNLDVLVEAGAIVGIGRGLKAPRGEEAIDCSGKVLMPGLVNTHTHLGMHSLRGKSDGRELFEWLEELEPLEKKLSAKDVRENTEAGMREAMRFGTTTVYDSYKFPEERLEAFEKAGMRGVISSTMRDEKTFKGATAFVKGMKSALVKGAIAPNSIYACGEEILRKAIDFSERENVLRRIHVGETRKERFDTLQKTGKLAVEYLDSIGFLGESALLVHCIWVTKGEIRKIARSGAKVSHNPVSNMKLASGGVMPLVEMLGEKVCVGLGTDSVASNNNLDMFEEMKVCALLHRHHKWNPAAVSSQEALDMATINAARCLGLGKEVGSVEIGKKADMITLGLSENMVPVNDLVSNIVFAGQGLNVGDVIIDGKLKLVSGQFT